MGKVIVLEGTDASGKNTQANLLYERLKNEGYNVRLVSFPNYSDESSIFVRRYLQGEYGKEANSVSPFTASTFYALDRYDMFYGKSNLIDFYNNGGIIICDRYTTSNMVHQASKYDSTYLKGEYLMWLADFEYNKLQIPNPDLVYFLDMPTEFALKLRDKRGNENDIHESDVQHLTKAYENAHWVAKRSGWLRLTCVIGEEIKSIQTIHEELYKSIKLNLSVWNQK